MVTRLISETEKTRWVIALMTIWVFLGLVGHDPWKPDEAQTFGVVWRAIQHGNWLLPHLAGERYEELPGLTYWSAAAFAWLFQSLLPLHDGARLSSGAWIGLSFWLVGQCSRELFGKGSGRYAVLALAGCLGFFERAHLLLVDNTFLAGIALTLYALLRVQRTATKSAWLLALGVLIAFLSKGLFGVCFCIAMIAGSVWITRKASAPHAPRVLFYALGFVGAGVATWAIAITLADAGALKIWLTREWQDFVGDRTPVEPLSSLVFICKTLVWFAFPALPLALWSARLMQRGFIGGLGQWQFRVPTAIFLAMLAAILIAGNPRTTTLMPLLLPLALLAYPGLDHLKRGHSAFLDWVGIVFFGTAMLLAWVFWSSLYLGAPRGIFSKVLNNFQPGFSEPVRPFATAVALLLTIFWFAMIRPARRTHKRALVNWTVGMTSVWGVGMLLFTPYLDYGKSYRIPIGQVFSQTDPLVRSGLRCVASAGLGPAQRAMFDYMQNVVTRRVERTEQPQCDWLIVQANTDNKFKFNVPADEFERVGIMMRPGGVEEPWILYKRLAK